MANVSDPTFRFATNVFDTDGTDKVYNISFDLGYIDSDYVVAMSGVEDPDTKLLTDMQAHVVSFIDTPPGNRVKVTPVPAAERKLIIFRQTDISKLLVRFQDGKLQTGRNLDLNSTQLIMAIQEILDGLRNNNMIVEQQISTVVDMNKIINEIYTQVIELLAAGGIVSVAPRVWHGEFDPDNDDETDWEIPGADVSGAGFYDTYIDGIGMEPDVDYSIILPTKDDPRSLIRFTKPLTVGQKWFTVLRGYAKPYTGPQPITTLAFPIQTYAGGTLFIGKPQEFALIRCTSDSDVVATIKLIPETGDNRLVSGSWVNIVPRGAGRVRIAFDPGVTLAVPDGLKAEARAKNSVITLTCEDADTNVWLVSGDLSIQE
ncbi:tail fiber [Stenotrophomonas phage c9-N]|uniref:Tail fiber n=1 Tax=Stenotrophomonas phage vB_SmeS_BUCT700 TaxID=2924895 RepID=A0AAE9GD19_9CAUD|nr:tail fiber [Stenotrophomonas phage vB_SmeS_BUCT700]UNY50269.1 tail fiber [Stenotrophomonas phage vB_SmeS_BUCT703]WKC56430.1 tail fiber [Stenotrophomonas phage c9-N]